jgi:hypothetical protein
MLSNSRTVFFKNQHFFIAEPPLQQNLCRVRIPYDRGTIFDFGRISQLHRRPGTGRGPFQTVHLQVKSERQGAKFTGKSSLQSKCKTNIGKRNHNSKEDNRPVDFVNSRAPQRRPEWPLFLHLLVQLERKNDVKAVGPPMYAGGLRNTAPGNSQVLRYPPIHRICGLDDKFVVLLVKLNDRKAEFVPCIRRMTMTDLFIFSAG